ncbi:hypothetical protein ACT8ZV_11095 [Nocardioides sp. MAHUQ-72]|uniref:hypothetical protein n=1 Tax=unclassified Nocardioides TaxID=2615069 RepID=UPI0036148741
MQRPELPLTLGTALAWARATSRRPGELNRFPHPGFDGDETCGGFAFTDGQELLVAAYDGTFGSSMLSAFDPGEVLDEWLARARRRHRDLSWDELRPWQQAAVEAVRRGVPSSSLGDPRLTGDLDRDYADWLWLRLRRSSRDPLRVLAAEDALMAPPRSPGRHGAYTHACPLCGLPAPHTDRYPRAVCDDCTERTTDSRGRRVRGRNVSFSGGFEAYLVDGEGADTSPCEEVTASGRCWVDGHECSIGEARFGGVVVEALDG